MFSESFQNIFLQYHRVTVYKVTESMLKKFQYYIVLPRKNVDMVVFWNQFIYSEGGLWMLDKWLLWRYFLSQRPIILRKKQSWNWITNNLMHHCRGIFSWNSCRTRKKIIKKGTIDLQRVIFAENSSTISKFWEDYWVTGVCAKFSILVKRPWRPKKIGFLEISVSEVLSNSVWMKPLMISFLKLSASVFLC